MLGAAVIATALVAAGVPLPDIEDVGEDMRVTAATAFCCSRATRRSSCKKSNPDDCRLAGGFGFDCMEGEEMDTGADALACARARESKTFCGTFTTPSGGGDLEDGCKA